MYSKLHEDGGKKMIYKKARHMNEYSNNVKGRTFIKDELGS